MKKLLLVSAIFFAVIALPKVSYALADGGPCALTSCQGANTDFFTVAGGTTQACVCGSGTATSTTPFCNASKSTGYADATSCLAGTAGTQQPSGTGFTSKIPQAIPTVGPTSVGEVFTKLDQWGNWLFFFFMVIALFSLIWGAVDFISAGGDAAKIKSAREKLLWTVVAIGFALLAVFLPGIVKSFLGVS